MTFPFILPAVSAAALSACAFFPALGLRCRSRLFVLVVLSVPILLSPLIIPADARFIRWITGINAVLLLLKLVDLHLSAEQASPVSVRAFAGFLFNPCSYVLRQLDEEPRPCMNENLRLLALGVVGYVVPTVLLLGLFRIDWAPYNFALEHSLKVVLLLLSIVGLLACVVALWRLVGGRARDFMGNIVTARTPAEFWRRYNRPVHQFFHENVFKGAGGRRAPVRATFVVFALSAIMHEYVYSISIGRIEGFQLMFFALHGLAVGATMHIKPRAWLSYPWMAATFAFNIASSILFFASFDAVMPFYSAGRPQWLPHL